MPHTWYFHIWGVYTYMQSFLEAGMPLWLIWNQGLFSCIMVPTAFFFDEHTSFFMVGREFCLTPWWWALRAFCIALMLRKGTSLFRCTAPSIWSLSWCEFWAVSSHSELWPPGWGTDKQSLGAKGMVSCPLWLSDAFSPLLLLAWSPPSKPESSSEDRTQLGPSSSLPSPSHLSSNVEDTQWVSAKYNINRVKFHLWFLQGDPFTL